MKIERMLFATAILGTAVAASPGAWAQSCSGGSDGGMDATGTECGVSAQTTTEVDPSLWTMIASRLAPSAVHVGAVNDPPFPGGVRKVSAPLASGMPASTEPAAPEGPIH